MKIHINRIPAGGLKEHASYDPSTMDMERDDIHLDQPFEVDALITKLENELIVNASVRCPLRLSCGRCLEDFSHEAKIEALLNYKVQPSDVVDITDDIRQEIILSYPMIPLCQKDCKGLCKACGQNLNISQCTHVFSGRQK